MEEIRLSDSECRLMAVIWEEEPVNSTELVKCCEKKYDWKKSTTYTILKKLEQKGAVSNKDATVTSLVDRKQVIGTEGQSLMERTGSKLPDFIAAFLQDRKLSKEEAKRLYEIIQNAEDIQNANE